MARKTRKEWKGRCRKLRRRVANLKQLCDEARRQRDEFEREARENGARAERLERHFDQMCRSKNAHLDIGWQTRLCLEDEDERLELPEGATGDDDEESWSTLQIAQYRMNELLYARLKAERLTKELVVLEEKLRLLEQKVEEWEGKEK